MQIHSAFVSEGTEFTHINITQKRSGTPVGDILIMTDPKRYSSWFIIVNVEDTIYFGCDKDWQNYYSPSARPRLWA